jgi:predicted nucleotidyltransferase
MYIRLVSMLAKECESRLGKPPCDYAIIGLGSVARMEATPFSDLEFAILYSDPEIGDKIRYFRILSHFLHLKVINLGEPSCLHWGLRSSTILDPRIPIEIGSTTRKRLEVFRSMEQCHGRPKLR